MIYSRPWTNLILLMAIKMVLCGAGASADVLSDASRVRRAPQPHRPHRVLTDEELDASAAWKRSHWREMQAILRHEGSDNVIECCPSVVEMVAPIGGRNLSGFYVDLYRDGEIKQQLYELSCAADVVNKPCRFVDARLYNQTRCVQKYSYSYALVRSPSNGTEKLPHRHRREGQFFVPGGWSMDYVRVRAGCECQLTPKRRAPHRKRLERHKQRRRNKKLEEDDGT